MTAVAVALAALSATLYAWSYLAYPPLIAALARRARGAPVPEEAPPPAVEVVISAADEEAVIAARVTNLLAQEAPRPPAVTVGCDGCVDGTAAAARAAGDGRVRVVEFRTRRGKASVLNDLVRGSTADVLVFTDANTAFEPGAVRALVAALADPAVGAACGRLRFETAPGAAPTPEAVYWDRETALKEAEGGLGICLGANGGIYAARRELVSPLPPDTTSMDDFLIPIRVARAGRRVVFAGDAVAREDAARDAASEAARRFRIGIGAGQVLRRERWLWLPGAPPRLTLAFLSRKAARWLAPLLALLAGAAALGSPRLRAAGAVLLAAAALVLVSARRAPRGSGPVGRLYYFAVINVALALGVAAGLAGYARPVWTRTARS